MADSGLRATVLPYLAKLAGGVTDDVPFVSIGANLGVYSSFEGANFEGRGSGVATVNVSTVQGAQALADAFAGTAELPFVSFDGATMDRANWTAATGASRWPLSYGLAVVNLVATKFDRFHLPSDANLSSVNVSALNALTSSVAQALEAYVCAATCV